jgi:exosortase/archaeosortase family protein
LAKKKKKERRNPPGNPKTPEKKKDGKARRPKPTFKDYITKLMPLIKAFVLWFILVSIVQIPAIKEDFRSFIVGFTTASTVFVGKLFFLPIVRTGFETIQVSGFSMEVIVECTAYNFYLFSITLAAFADWTWKRKLINFLIFLGIIFFVNNLRFYAMGYVGRYYPEFFDSTHDYVWNILFGFMIFGVWAWRDGKDNIHLKAMKAAKNET